MRRIANLILSVFLAAILVTYHTHTAERDVVCLWKYSYEFLISGESSSAKTFPRNAPAARARYGKKKK